MSRKRVLKRRQTLCTTISQDAFDRVVELAENTTEGNVSRMVEKLINDYWTEWFRVVGAKDDINFKTEDNDK